MVRNLRLCDGRPLIEEDKSEYKLIKKYKVKVIDFSKLGYSKIYTINQK